MDKIADLWSIVFSGVGGQGVLLAAEIAAIAAVSAGYDVKQTEVHGVSQRGGSVESQVRFGSKVWSPIVTPGQADIVVGLEELEGLRAAHYTHATQGTIVINELRIMPASIDDAENKYPQDTKHFLSEKGYQVISILASKTAKDLGDGRMANVVMLGAISRLLPIDDETWISTLKGRIPEKYREPNLKAFEAGKQFVEAARI